MSITLLSEEVLGHIFSYLPLSDRRNCAQTCRKWAQAMGAPALTRDMWFHVKGSEMEEAEAIVDRSYRQYRNLRLSDASLFHFNSSFWTRIGESLRKLELIECFWSPDVYYRILQVCSKLESLTICSAKQLLTRLNFELPPWVTLQSTQEALRNVRHLHLKFFLNADMLWLLLAPMMNVETITLSRFDGRSDFLDRLRDILGEHRKITMLDLDPRYVKDHAGEQVMRVCADTVRAIRILGKVFVPRVYQAIAECTGLRSLSLKLVREVGDAFLQTILLKTPDLETLDLWYESGVASVDILVEIFELTKLRELSIRFGRKRGHARPEMTQFLNGLGAIPTLERLELDMDDCIVTEMAIRTITSLRNLQILTLRNIFWNADCPKVLSSPKHLETLKIKCHNTRRGRYNPALKFAWADSVMTFKSDSEEKPETSSLKALRFDSGPVTDVDLECVAANHDRLKSITLWNCNTVTDAGLTHLLKREPVLEELRVRCRCTLKGTFLEALEGLCPRLQNLHISDFSEADRATAELFKLQRPTVTVYYNAQSVALALPCIEELL